MAYLLLLFPVITARKRSLGQGNIFAPVCHSVHGGVIPACIAGGIPACFVAGLLGEGVVSQHALQQVSRPTARGEVEGCGRGVYPSTH